MKLPAFFRSYDLIYCFLLFTIAILLRYPFVSHPNMSMFDELLYKNYVSMTLAGEPSFDIHPPLAKLLMIKVSEHYDFPLSHNKVKAMEPFGEFPYVPLRELSALFGAILPLFVYGIGRKIGYERKIALIPAFLVTTDNALITYSRVMLPDMILLTLIAAGIFFTVAAISTLGHKRTLYSALSIIVLSAAFSVKWTALGVIVVAVALFVRKKMWKSILGIFIIAPIVYITSFLLFFQFFPAGGQMLPMFAGSDDPFNVAWITEPAFPHGGNLDEALAFLPTLHGIILRTNSDPEIMNQVFRSKPAYLWPLGRSGILFWHSRVSDALIRFSGNVVVWGIAFLLFLYECFSITWAFFRKTFKQFDDFELFLVAGYLVNFLPFLIIDRPMYLYHYFTALLFLFLLIPKVLPRLSADLVRLTGNAKLPRILLTLAIVFSVSCFFLLLPTTYGFTFFG